MFTIYHNNRCSKSRQTLELLNNAVNDITVVDYLNTPPSVEELKHLLSLLGFSDVRQLMRTKETLYKELALDDDSLSQEALLTAMTANPKLIERPIVVKGNQAVLGRPPENINKLLG